VVGVRGFGSTLMRNDSHVHRASTPAEHGCLGAAVAAAAAAAAATRKMGPLC